MIEFVIGPACSGKSTFIKNTFPHSVTVDLWDFQKECKYLTYMDVKDSYEEAKQKLIEEIENPHKLIVFEHTLLKRERRKDYIDAIRKVTDEPINCYVMIPEEEEYKRRCRKRDVLPSTMDFTVLEIPTTDEGFNAVYVIK